MKKCALLVYLALLCSIVYGQNNYRTHSVFIYSFTRHVIWPEDFNQGDFEIVVMGDSPILEELKLLASTKKVGERSIKVSKINSPAELKKCNILFLPANQAAQFGALISKINNQSILLVTEEPGMGAKGSDVNFIMKDGKLAFELNQGAANKQNLKFSNTLTTMAIMI